MAKKGTRYRKYSPEMKIKAVRMLLNAEISVGKLSKDIGADSHVIRKWRDKYLEYGETYFYEEHRGKGKHSGNPYAALHTSKNLTEEERLRLENLKLRIENERLKKGYLVKGVGANKEYVTSLDVNTKSSKN